MHIILTSEELECLDICKLPNGTTLVECVSDVPVKSYIIENKNLNLTNDFVERDRKWLDGEEEKFIKGKTKKDVLNYFLNHNDDGPQREYTTMRNLEFEWFSFIRSSGSYITIDDNRYNLFQIYINRDSDLKEAEKEISWALNKIAQYYKNISTIELRIFEHTLSQNCSYIILWDRNKKFEICIERFGRREVIKKFNSLTELIKYISIYHYYK